MGVCVCPQSRGVNAHSILEAGRSFQGTNTLFRSTMPNPSDHRCPSLEEQCIFTVFISVCEKVLVAQTVACQGPVSMGFSRQEYWSG